MKLLSSGVLIFIFIFVLLSTSRQSALFSIICGVGFFIMNTRKAFLKKGLSFLLLLLIGIFMFQQFTKGQVLDENFVQKYQDVSGLMKTSRLDIAKEGLALLDSHEYFTGAGLTSVITSGPHNDFIRWMQRVGVFAMLIGFFPFLMAAKKSYQYLARNKNPNLMLYLFLSVLFTLFHSCFGYPREDAYQALYCFLGLALWLGYGKNTIFLERKALGKSPQLSNVVN